MMVNSAQPAEGGGGGVHSKPSPFHSNYHHEQSWGVRSIERADTLIFLLYPNMYSVAAPFDGKSRFEQLYPSLFSSEFQQGPMGR